jgi:hypothetical protein
MPTQKFVGNLLPPATGGVDFSNTTPLAGMSSQNLANYEYGTWTPSIGGDATYTIQEGYYVRIGKLVFIQGKLVINVIGTGSVNTVSGLPYTVLDSTSGSGGFGGATFFLGIATSVYSLIPTPMESTTTLTFYGGTVIDTRLWQINVFQDSARVDFSATYLT